ncbi:hypothetical protein D3C80_1829470 [compost metagenome]
MMGSSLSDDDTFQHHTHSHHPIEQTCHLLVVVVHIHSCSSPPHQSPPQLHLHSNNIVLELVVLVLELELVHSKTLLLVLVVVVWWKKLVSQC